MDPSCVPLPSRIPDIITVPLDNILGGLRRSVSKPYNNDRKWRRKLLTGSATTRAASASAQRGAKMERIFE
jgi:hypothetical protein